MSVIEYWGGRHWLPSFMKYTLITSEEEWLAEMRRLDIKDPELWIPKTAGACTHEFEGDKGQDDFCIVTMRYDGTLSYNEYVAMLVHEAVHVFQKICKVIGEKYPSIEFEAYGVQTIAMDLMYHFAEKHYPDAITDPKQEGRPVSGSERGVPVTTEESGVDAAAAYFDRRRTDES